MEQIYPTWNYALIVLAILIALMGSYSTWDFVSHLPRLSGKKFAIWFMVAVLLFGLGIWSLHFLVLVAYQLPFPVKWNWLMMLVSFFFALLASTAGLYFFSRVGMDGGRFFIATLVASFSILSMHYTSMEALEVNLVIQYDPLRVIIASIGVLLSIVLSFYLPLLLERVPRERHKTVRFVGSALIALVIPLTYMIAMTSVTFWRVPFGADIVSRHGDLSVGLSVLLIILSTFLGAGGMMASSFIERFRQKTLAQLWESELRFKSVMNSSLVGVVLRDISGKIYDVNQAFVNLLGYTREELLASSFTCEDISPEEYWIKDRQAMLSLKEGQAIAYEKQFIRKDGSRVDIFISTSLLDERTKKAVSLVIDISERKQFERALEASEARYRRIIETSLEGIWILDKEFRTTFVNRQMAELLGYPAEYIIGKHPWEFTAPEYIGEIKEHFRSRRRGKSEQYESVFFNAKGEEVYMLVSGVPLYGETGEYLGSFAMFMDITKRKLAEKALAESEAKYRQIVESATEGIWVLDANDRTVFVNQQMAEMLGYSEAELMGCYPYEFNRDQYVDESKRRLENAHQGLKERFEIKFVHKNGNEIWVFLSSSPLYDDQGNYAGVMGLFTDITERKQIEKALAESEAKYRLIVESATEGILLFDAQDRITFANRQFLEMVGYTMDELLGDNSFKFTNAEEARKHLSRRHQGIVERYDIEIITKEGRKGWVRISGNPVYDEQGNYQGSLSLVSDITKQKLAQQKLEETLQRESLIRSITEVISQTFDINYILSVSTQKIARYFEADRCLVLQYSERGKKIKTKIAGEYTGAQIPPLNPEDMSLAVYEDILTYQVSKKKFNEYVLNASSAEEHIQLIKRHFIDILDLPGQGYPWKDSYEKELREWHERNGVHSLLGVEIVYRGEPYGYLILHQCTGPREWTESDVEQLKMLSSHLGDAFYQVRLFTHEQEARQEAEMANQKKSQFLAVMSHELRTPLNSIIGYAEMLQAGIGGELTEKQHKYAHNVVISGHHLLDMVNDILDLTKVSAGKISLNIERVDLYVMIKEIGGMLAKFASQRDVQLHFEVAPGLETAEADPVRLRQIYLNLINNAIKFNRPGGQVWVRIYLSEDRNWLISEIEDTGIGIPQDKLPEVFKEFAQLDTSFARRQEGTGLGLALSRRLVEMHGGTIYVKTEEGVGSTFIFTLPTGEQAYRSAEKMHLPEERNFLETPLSVSDEM